MDCRKGVDTMPVYVIEQSETTYTQWTVEAENEDTARELHKEGKTRYMGKVGGPYPNDDVTVREVPVPG